MSTQMRRLYGLSKFDYGGGADGRPKTNNIICHGQQQILKRTKFNQTDDLTAVVLCKSRMDPFYLFSCSVLPLLHHRQGRYGVDILTINKCRIVFNVCRYCSLGGEHKRIWNLIP